MARKLMKVVRKVLSPRKKQSQPVLSEGVGPSPVQPPTPIPIKEFEGFQLPVNLSRGTRDCPETQGWAETHSSICVGDSLATKVSLCPL